MELPHDLLYDILLYAPKMNTLLRVNKLTNDIGNDSTFWTKKMAYFEFEQYDAMVKEHNRQIAIYNPSSKEIYYKYYNAIDKVNNFPVSTKYTQIHFMVENYSYVLEKFRITKYNHDLYCTIYLILFQGKIMLRFSDFQIEITKEEFNDILFHVFYANKQLNILYPFK